MAKPSFSSVLVNVLAAASITAIIVLITLGSFSQIQDNAGYKQSVVKNEFDDSI